LWSFDLTGKLLWVEKLEAYPIYGECGTGASPAMAGDQIIILNDNEKQPFIESYDKRTGKRLWRTDRSVGNHVRKTGWSTPFVWKNALRRGWSRDRAELRPRGERAVAPLRNVLDRDTDALCL
jgi:hypothetical protein